MTNTRKTSLDGLSEEGILGNDFLESDEARIDYGAQRMRLTLEGIDKEIPFGQNEHGRHSIIHSISTQIVRGGMEEWRLD